MTAKGEERSCAAVRSHGRYAGPSRHSPLLRGSRRDREGNRQGGRIPLKNPRLIEGRGADSIPPMGGRIGDDGTEE
ncbi:hypothetical protein, partial [Roseivivax lentus]|uniref:hypothetical protein n=1 Tax=Roseivivax lentus TaxID=633194 RepID=UPI001F464054